MKKFEETGSVADRPKSGRRSLSDERTDAVKEAVGEIGAINEWGVFSVRSTSHSTAIHRTIIIQKISHISAPLLANSRLRKPEGIRYMVVRKPSRQSRQCSMDR